MKPFLRSVLFSIVLAAISSCSPMVDMRGHSAEQLDTSQIVIGQTRAEDVQALLGSPTAESNFGNKIWYYMSEKRETVGFYAPDVVNQHVTAIAFDADGAVAEITTTGMEASKPVQYVEKTTPTEGRKTTAIEQMMGNLGKFNAPSRGIDPRNLGR